VISVGWQQMVMCKPEKDAWYEKMLPGTPALLVSIVALIVSAKSFNYSKKKDSRARTQSIIDDYWLRKVVSPVSIEPLLKLTAAFASSLPTDLDLPDAIQKYWNDKIKEAAELNVGFLALRLIDNSLSGAVERWLEELEDVLAQYCGDLIEHLKNGGPKPDRKEALRSIQHVSISIFSEIKKHQVVVE